MIGSPPYTHHSRGAGRLTAMLAIVGICCTAVVAMWLAASLRGQVSPPAGQPGDITASTSEAPQQLGPSGLPLPRFVTLKANKVNVRKGPSSDHAVAWVFQRKGLPVEITAEFENWRKIRDSEGAEGWILQSMLSGKRTAMVASWARNKTAVLHEDGKPGSAAVARLSTGVVGEIERCDGDWCQLTAGGYEGFARQSELWGVYPGEKVD